MDWMTPIGFIIGLGSVGFVLIEGNSVGLILNMHAILLVFGGTLGATLLSYPSGVVFQAFRSVRVFLFPGSRPDTTAVVQTIVRLAEKSKRQGLDSLEADLAQIRIPFLVNGLRLVLDGVPADIIRSNMIKEIRFARDRHSQVCNVFRSAAAYAPIFGLLGTLVGVVQVLMTLTDPKTIGASMAIAMTATFYGIFGANFMFLPIASKLNVYSQEEIFLEELIIEGVQCIQQNEVPALTMRKLQSFADAHKRDQVQNTVGAGRGAARAAPLRKNPGAEPHDSGEAMIEKLGPVFIERRNQYIWLTIYSDLITNLFLLFLSLYALSFFGPDAIPEAMASMKNRLEYSRKASPWYEDLTRDLKMVSNQAAPIVAREDRLQMALPDDVLFAVGAGELKDHDQFVLHSIAQALKSVPYTVLVEGHTDNEALKPGSRYASNWELSLARAMSVVNYMVKFEGIAPERLGVAAFGEYHPRFPNDTPAHRRANRRIEISILRYE